MCEFCTDGIDNTPEPEPKRSEETKFEFPKGMPEAMRKVLAAIAKDLDVPIEAIKPELLSHDLEGGVVKIEVDGDAARKVRTDKIMADTKVTDDALAAILGGEATDSTIFREKVRKALEMEMFVGMSMFMGLAGVMKQIGMPKGAFMTLAAAMAQGMSWNTTLTEYVVEAAFNYVGSDSQPDHDTFKAVAKGAGEEFATEHVSHGWKQPKSPDQPFTPRYLSEFTLDEVLPDQCITNHLPTGLFWGDGLMELIGKMYDEMDH